MNLFALDLVALDLEFDVSRVVLKSIYAYVVSLGVLGQHSYCMLRIVGYDHRHDVILGEDIGLVCKG